MDIPVLPVQQVLQDLLGLKVLLDTLGQQEPQVQRALQDLLVIKDLLVILGQQDLLVQPALQDPRAKMVS